MAEQDRHKNAPYPIRMPPEMRRALEIEASQHRCPLHTRILVILENHLKKDDKS